MSEEQPASSLQGSTATGTLSRTVVLPRPLEALPPDYAPPVDGEDSVSLIPRSEAPLPVGHRRCPTPPGHLQALVRQTIALSDCEQRQCEGYHKCFHCIYHDRSSFRGNELPPVDNRSSKLALARRNGRPVPPA